MHLFVSPLGLTGHTEVVRVVFSPKDLSLETLLKHFWERHDPTQGSNLYTHKKSKCRPQITPVPKGTRCIRAEGRCPGVRLCVLYVGEVDLMGVSQCQTVLMCLSSSHPWRGTPVGRVQALTAKNPPSYNIQGMLLSAVTNDGAGNTFNLAWAEYLQVFNYAECVSCTTVIRRHR